MHNYLSCQFSHAVVLDGTAGKVGVRQEGKLVDGSENKGTVGSVAFL